MQDRLMRSRQDRMIAGVCGGLGAYFDIDPTLVRLVVVLLTIVTWGGGILPYVILCLLMPKQPPQVTPFTPTPPDLPGPWATPPALPDNWSHQPQNIRMAPPGSWQDQPMRFDPYTGQPLQPLSSEAAPAADATLPAVGATIQLEREEAPAGQRTGVRTAPSVDFDQAADAGRPMASPAAQPEPDQTWKPGVAFPPPAPKPFMPSRRGFSRQRRPTLGLILVGIGILALADQLQIVAFLFPLALIAVGAFLLLRRG